MATFPIPHPGASLLLAFAPSTSPTTSSIASFTRDTILILGTNHLASLRTLAALEAGYRVVLASPLNSSSETWDEELQWRLERQEVQKCDLPRSDQPDAEEWSTWLDNLNFFDSLAFLIVSDPSFLGNSTAAFRKTCFRRRVPMTIADHPTLSDFSFPITHRFLSSNAPRTPTPLQLALSTTASSCRLAVRLRRLIVAALPDAVGDACVAVGELRARARGRGAGRGTCGSRSKSREWDKEGEEGEKEEELISSGASPLALNAPVPQLPAIPTLQTPNAEDVITRATRMRWVAQISEYWPLENIAKLRGNSEALDEALGGFVADTDTSSLATTTPLGNSFADPTLSTHHQFLIPPLPMPLKPQGRILLVGSGPGHPSLLTLAAYTALTSHATLVLADKLVPSEVLALIPQGVEVRIAKKWPGNAERAQEEFMRVAVEAAAKGECVVRLKQGDPYLYGRGGEELLHFRAHGFPPLVIPGISSVLAAPLLTGIPVTQRGAAESMTVCTGVGRLGKAVKLPGYERGRTLVVLMGVARLQQVVRTLCDPSPVTEGRNGAAYPPHLPIAIIERASSPDQRLTASTLSEIVKVLERGGEQRPPGMMVIGWAVLSLEGEGDVTVLDDTEGEGDLERVKRWLGRGEGGGIVREGLGTEWDGFMKDFRRVIA